MFRLFSACCLAFCLFSQSVFSDISDQLNRTKALKRAHVGICVVDLESGEEVYQHNQESFFVPASVQKLVTSVAAIDLLGLEYCFETDLEYEGIIDVKGTLHGNLWVHGGGDPTLSLDIFSQWKNALDSLGIKKIDGSVFIDASHFETLLASPFWSFEDLGNYYGVGASALSINQNTYKIFFKPGEQKGDPATIVRTEPEIPYLQVYNEVVTAEKGSGDNVYVFGSEYSPIQYYRGTVPLGESEFVVKASIPDPTLLVSESLGQLLKPSNGVKIVRKKFFIDRSKRKHIVKHKSVPLRELLLAMNEQSINLYAEHLIKAIGRGSAGEGLKKIEVFLKNKGIPSQIKDGSGLARTNLLTPQGCVALLSLIHSSAKYQPIYDSLPEPGKSGSLKNFPLLMNASIKAKSGSMGNIYNLGGYLILSPSKKYAFSIFFNNYQGPLKEVRQEIADLLDSLAADLKAK